MILVYLIRYKRHESETLPYLIVIGMMLQGAGISAKYKNVLPNKLNYFYFRSPRHNLCNSFWRFIRIQDLGI
jgi:hypothetical protein